MFNLDTLTSCLVKAKLDGPRQGHIGAGDLVCGGRGKEGDYDGYRLTNCYNIVTGANITFNNRRTVFTSWSTDAGLYLISGYPNGRTSDLVKTDGTTEEGFRLREDSRYLQGVPKKDWL